jgi:serine/threonine-protein kinase RsbT
MSNEKTPWEEVARVPVATMQDVMLARFIGRAEATKLGFAPSAMTRIATAISELTRNVFQHAGSPGEICLAKAADGDRRGLRITVSDKGRGIEHPERFMEKGKGTLGAGLPGTRQLMDDFRIQSAPGTGTTVTTEIWT